MIRIKTKDEIEILRKGGKILSNILEKIIIKVRPGVETGDLEKMACDLIRKAGGYPSFKGYAMHDGIIFPTALCTSINEEIVHAPAFPSRKLNSGDIIGIDIGMKYPNKKHKRGYYTDMSKTVPVGKIDEKVKKLIKITRECLDLAIKEVKPGNTLSDIGRAVQHHAESNGFSVVRELVGHGVGHCVHEDPQIPNYEIIDNSLENAVLKPGMVIAIEPMINMGTWKVKTASDGFTVITADNKLSAHFEHTVAVMEDENKVLTAL